MTGNLLVDTLVMDTTGVVMQNNIWNCGPASLATVLNRLGVTNVTQDEIASLAGTDYTGTSMAGLAYAANLKGSNQNITATGMLITNVAQLQPNNIVLLSSVSGLYHYCVITGISSTTVFLADSEIGNINMTIGNFTSVYMGYVLVVTNDTNNTQFNNGTFINPQTMETIKGTELSDVVITIGETIGIGAGGVAGGVLVLTGVGLCVLANEMSAIAPRHLKTQSWPNTIPGSWLTQMLDEGYNYSYSISYSYNHGYRTRSRPLSYSRPYAPPVYTYSYYTTAADGSYVLVTGTTTGNPDELKNQKILDAYNQKKAQELAKITGIIDAYLSGVRPKNPIPDLRSGEEQYAELQKNGGIIRIPDDKDDDDRWDKVAEKLKEYGKMFKEGLAKRDPKKIITGGIVVGLGVEMVICALIEANSEIIKELLENVNKTVKYLYITKA